jgi:hypothetical protein
MHEVGKSKTLLCFAHFDTVRNAEYVAHTLAEQPTVRDFKPAAELFMV